MVGSCGLDPHNGEGGAFPPSPDGEKGFTFHAKGSIMDSLTVDDAIRLLTEVANSRRQLTSHEAGMVLYVLKDLKYQIKRDKVLRTLEDGKK